MLCFTQKTTLWVTCITCTELGRLPWGSAGAFMTSSPQSREEEGSQGQLHWTCKTSCEEAKLHAPVILKNFFSLLSNGRAAVARG